MCLFTHFTIWLWWRWVRVCKLSTPFSLSIERELWVFHPGYQRDLKNATDHRQNMEWLTPCEALGNRHTQCAKVVLSRKYEESQIRLQSRGSAAGQPPHPTFVALTYWIVRKTSGTPNVSSQLSFLFPGVGTLVCSTVNMWSWECIAYPS